jgi:putative FmdB family regulatory protein
MPVYEYYCRTCATKFERLRPMRAAEEPAACPAGHDGAARTLSVFAVSRGSDGGFEPMGMGGGCGCGGACACGGGMGRN